MVGAADQHEACECAVANLLARLEQMVAQGRVTVDQRGARVRCNYLRRSAPGVTGACMSSERARGARAQSRLQRPPLQHQLSALAAGGTHFSACLRLLVKTRLGRPPEYDLTTW